MINKNRKSKLSFDEWMVYIQSIHYTDNDAMSRARENLLNEKQNGINTTSARSPQSEFDYIAEQQQISN